MSPGVPAGPHPSPPVPLLLTEDEAASLLAVSYRTVRRLAAAGKLEPVHIGGATRYRLADVQELAGVRERGGP